MIVYFLMGSPELLRKERLDSENLRDQTNLRECKDADKRLEKMQFKQNLEKKTTCFTNQKEIVCIFQGVKKEQW